MINNVLMQWIKDKLNSRLSKNNYYSCKQSWIYHVWSWNTWKEKLEKATKTVRIDFTL